MKKRIPYSEGTADQKFPKGPIKEVQLHFDNCKLIIPENIAEKWWDDISEATRGNPSITAKLTNHGNDAFIEFEQPETNNKEAEDWVKNRLVEKYGLNAEDYNPIFIATLCSDYHKFKSE